MAKIRDYFNIIKNSALFRRFLFREQKNTSIFVAVYAQLMIRYEERLPLRDICYCRTFIGFLFFHQVCAGWYLFAGRSAHTNGQQGSKAVELIIIPSSKPELQMV